MFRFIYLIALVALVACGSQPQNTQNQTQSLGLLKVTVTGLGDGATPSATAEMVVPAKAFGPSRQSATVVPVNGTSALNDVQFSRAAVNFSDDDLSSTRYVYTSFDLTNRTTTAFNNLTLYAVNVSTNIGGTGIAAMTAATGAAITDEGVARGFQPIHGVRPTQASVRVSQELSDLQWFPANEVSNTTNGIKQQAVLAGIIPAGSTVLQYGFVARNLSGGRSIAARDSNVSPGCNTNACKGTVTLAYKFPRISPRQNNPFSFTLYFVVADETDSHISQSLEEQPANTAAGQNTSSLGSYNKLRTLFGTNYFGSNNQFICRVQTAVATTLNPSALYLPSGYPNPSAGSLDEPCFSTDGKATADFNNATDDYGQAVALQSDGKIVVAGYRTTNANGTDFALARFNPDGNLDNSFSGNGRLSTDFGLGQDERASGVVIQPDGKIVVAGYTDSNAGTNTSFVFGLARYNPDGTLDTSFDADGKVTTAIGASDDRANALALQSDGKIVVVGSSLNGIQHDFALARYNTNGLLDTTFDSDGKATTAIGSSTDEANAVAIQSDGKIVVAGQTTGTNLDFAVARYNTNGSLDTTFDTDGKVTTPVGTANDFIQSIALQNNGKIVAAGYSFSGGAAKLSLVRYNANGGLDSGFGTGGIVVSSIVTDASLANGVALQPDGKIVVGGQADTDPLPASSNYAFALLRYTSAGVLDTTFDGDGVAFTDFGSTSDEAKAIAIQSDGKIVLAGQTHNGLNVDFAVARYNP